MGQVSLSLLPSSGPLCSPDTVGTMSFVEISENSDFPLENLPYGIFSTAHNNDRHIGVAIGDYVLDVKQVADLNLLTGVLHEHRHVFLEKTLNKFMAMDRTFWKETRKQLQNLLAKDNSALQNELRDRVLIPQEETIMHLPAEIGDYTDFYSSLHHATNVGSMFRDPSNPLPPNWKHLPIAYHGRSSSVVVSGTDIKRPNGQTLPVEGQPPQYGPSKLMDFELEVAFFVGGPPTQLGTTLTMAEARERIFGFVLMNDWSARDIQKWEYFPLGPFLSKNLGTTISPWVVTMEALEPFLVENFPQDPTPLPYLQQEKSCNFDIELSVDLKTESISTTISRSNFKYLYWTPQQQLVHHSSTGCPMNPGDLLGSGTISGPTEDSFGCLLELTWKGSRPLKLVDGASRSFLKDYDEIVIRGHTSNGVKRIGFGECRGRLLPSST